MKTVFLKELELTNYKGVKHLKVNFNDKTSISGANATGKSTVFNAFVWLLFGKDQFSRKDYEITPVKNGVMLDKVDSDVSAVIDVDGVPVALKRVYHQKWQRPRGASEEVFKGYETQYWINDVPKKAGEYSKYVDGIIDETVFKLITNPSAFLALHWKEQREFLFTIAGTVSDAEIASRDPKFAELLDMVSGKSLAGFKTELSAKKKKLRAALDDIQPRINQTLRLTPETIDFTAIEKQVADIDAELVGISKAMSDRSEANKELYDKISVIRKQIDEKREKQREIVNKAKITAEEAASNANLDRNKIESSIKLHRQNVSEIEEDVKQTTVKFNNHSGLIKSLENSIETLRMQWDQENEKKYQAKGGCLICPMYHHQCTDPDAVGKHAESGDAAERTFNDEKLKKLTDITKNGQEKAKELEVAKQKLTDMQASLSEINTELEFGKNKLNELEQKLTTMPIEHAKGVFPDKLPEWASLEAEITTLNGKIKELEAVPSDDNKEKLITRKNDLTATRDELKTKLNNKTRITENKAEVVRLTDEGKNLAQQIADLEKIEFTINAFNKVRIDEVERKVNGMFDIVKFKLFDQTNDGNEFECCIATNKSGVPITATNTAEQINAGLDIIKVLGKFHNVSAPIFSDGAESVNKHYEAGSQMVLLRVTEDVELSIN